MAPVRVARALRLPIIAIMTALALSGCMRTTAPVAAVQRQGDLDSRAYAEPYNPAAAGVAPSSSTADSGGAISALRDTFAAAPRRSYAPVPVAYAAAPLPAPVAHDTAYRLDAGDRLRVVVYGQDGLTNTYAIDAGGPSTTPLIGPGPARRQKPRAFAARAA